jgi:hypothetical protein
MEGVTFGPFDSDEDQAGYEAFVEWLDQLETIEPGVCAICGGPAFTVVEGTDLCSDCKKYDDWHREHFGAWS